MRALATELPTTERRDDAVDLNFGQWKYVSAFVWDGDISEMRAAWMVAASAVWMAATAYANATDGVVFDEEQDKVRTAADARTGVDIVKREMPEMEAMLRELDKT